jgi:hypothetical protein
LNESSEGDDSDFERVRGGGGVKSFVWYPTIAFLMGGLFIDAFSCEKPPRVDSSSLRQESLEFGILDYIYLRALAQKESSDVAEVKSIARMRGVRPLVNSHLILL